MSVFVCPKGDYVHSGLFFVIAVSIMEVIYHMLKPAHAMTVAETLSRNERGRFGALKSDSTHHFFRNACAKSGSLLFSQFSGC
jgi:hypothetical protein